MKKSLYTPFLFMLLCSCGSPYVVKDKPADLTAGYGYLGFVINSVDKLYNIEFKHTEENSQYYIGSVTETGNTLFLLQVPEGEHCFVGFDAYDLRVDFTGQGFCTYVDAGEMNYFNHFLVRDPVSQAYSNYQQFVKLLQSKHPMLCAEYIGETCQQ